MIVHMNVYIYVLYKQCATYLSLLSCFAFSKKESEQWIWLDNIQYQTIMDEKYLLIYLI